jgi:predicted hydrocarbon binding protein
MAETIKLEDGKVTMNGVPFTFVLMNSVYYQYKELEKALGKDWKKLVYERGKNESEESIRGYFSMTHNHPNIQKIVRLFHGPLITFLTYQYNKLGIGRLELVAEDPSKPLIVLRLYFSPIALTYLEHEKAKEPVCYEFAGTMAGGAEFIYPGIEIVETKCLAKGDPYCEFVATIPKKR